MYETEYGVTQPAFVKFGNVHGDQYDIVLYSSDTCDGQIVGLVHNTNGCLPADVAGFGKVKTVRVVRTSSQKKKICRAEAESASDIEYNMNNILEGTIQNPFSPGVFVAINKDDYDGDGFYTSELAGEFNMHVPELTRANTTLFAYQVGTITPLDLRYQYCRWMATCRSVFSPLTRVDPSIWVNVLSERIVTSHGALFGKE